jgi:4-aminobutyrate aminotransferase
MSLPRIVVTPPGPKSRALTQTSSDYMSPSISHDYPAVFESAENCKVKDVDGNEFIDFTAAGGVMNIGHNHPRVLNAIKQQADKAVNYGLDIAYYELIPQLSNALKGILPGGGEKRFFYSTSGSEAVEAALKTAAWHTRGQTFFSFLGSMHGRTLGALSISSANPIHKKHFPSLLRTVNISYPYCYRCPLGQDASNCHCTCLDFLENSLAKSVPIEDVAAIALEPIQGEGCVVPPEAFFKRLQKLVRELGILLIADETLTGIGRTGRWLGLDNWEVTPDITCINGSLSSGLPLGVTVAQENVMDWEPDSHDCTLGGNPLACASALAVLDVIRSEHLLENAVTQGRYLLQRLREIAGKYPSIGEVRGKGLLIGLEIVKDTKESNHAVAKDIVTRSWQRGILTQLVGESTVRLSPPLSISQPLIYSALEILEGVFHETSIQ